MSFIAIGIVQMFLFHFLFMTWSFPRKAYKDKYKRVKISSLPKLHGTKKGNFSSLECFSCNFSGFGFGLFFSEFWFCWFFFPLTGSYFL